MIYTDETGVDIVLGTGDIGFRFGMIGNGKDKFGMLGFVQLPCTVGCGTKVTKELDEQMKHLQPQVTMCFPANDSKALDVVIKNLQELRRVVYGVYYYAVIYSDYEYEDNKLHNGFSISKSLEEAKTRLDVVEELFDGHRIFKIVKVKLLPWQVSQGETLYVIGESYYEELE